MIANVSIKPDGVDALLNRCADAALAVVELERYLYDEFYRHTKLGPQYLLFIAQLPVVPLQSSVLQRLPYYIGTNATYLLNKLVEMGYIERVACANKKADKRIRLYGITKLGLDLQKNILCALEHFQPKSPLLREK